MPIDRSILKQKISIYASAILASASGDLEKIYRFDDELYQVIKLHHRSNDLVHAFCDTSIPAEKREQAAREVFADFTDGLKDVLIVMAGQGDFDLISMVAEEYTDLAEEALGSTIVTVTTVVELDDHLRDVIKKKLSADFGTDVILREEIDKSIIGGIIMSAHGRRIDASVATRIDEVREALSSLPNGGER